MPNMGVRIAGQNKQKLDPKVDDKNKNQGCTCRQNPCPLRGECDKSDLVYKATIEGVPEPFFYYGSTSIKFIQRYHNHKSSFQHRDSKNSTVLSHKLCELRDMGLHPSVKLEFHCESNSGLSCAKHCNLCLREKYCIMYENSTLMLNSRQETYSRCKHRARWKVIHHV